jgi:hypothetical protein
MALCRSLKALRYGLRLLWRELSRLNSQGAGRIDNPVTRKKRSSAFRALIAEKYRDRSTCC